MDTTSKSLKKLDKSPQAFSGKTDSSARKVSEEAGKLGADGKIIHLQQFAAILEKIRHGYPEYDSPLSD